MGVKYLWDILESCKKTLPLHHLQNKRVCIDLSCWMVQLQNVSKSHNCVKEKVYLKGLFHRLRALLALNCSLIFVTDGAIPAIKLSTYRRRLNSGNEVDQDERSLQNGSSLRRNMGSEFSCMIKEAKMLGMALGIPCLDGEEEAEAQCALLNSESLCDGCFTSDSDIFLFGATTVYRDICLGDGGYVICYEMEDIERQLGFGRNSLIALALLLGSDYSQGVHGFGQESACHIVKSTGDDVILNRIVSGGLPFLKKTKGSKKQGKPPKANDKENLNHKLNVDGNEDRSQENEKFLQVINAYMKPKCHSADSAIVHRVLAQHPFERTSLHRTCFQLFEWPPEKTDEYILPKIAERDLRRFANLRSTSSAVGLEIPLNEIPVKCPVSGIIKRRKVQGRECFEVSWEGFQGLATAILPADLLESACPERIREFEDKISQGKKKKHPKPSQRKQKSVLSMEELDQRLQNLLLDIDSGSNADLNPSPAPLRIAMPEKQGVAVRVDVPDQVLLPDGDYTIDVDSISATPYGRPSSVASRVEFVDLSSPSPAICMRLATESKAGGGPDIIELSDSETDRSPEHEKKARELRLFISNIREDIIID